MILEKMSTKGEFGLMESRIESFRKDLEGLTECRDWLMTSSVVSRLAKLMEAESTTHRSELLKLAWNYHHVSREIHNFIPQTVWRTGRLESQLSTSLTELDIPSSWKPRRTHSNGALKLSFKMRIPARNSVNRLSTEFRPWLKMSGHQWSSIVGSSFGFFSRKWRFRTLPYGSRRSPS